MKYFYISTLIIVVSSCLLFFTMLERFGGYKQQYYYPTITVPPQKTETEIFFDSYEDTIRIILERETYKDSPITPKLLRDVAEETYQNTCIIVPAKLVLAQAMFESHIGLKGRSPETNPFNVGEFDDRTHLRFNTTCEGVKAYYKLLTKDYLRCKKPKDLLDNFTNCRGLRYASDRNYETKLRTAIRGIEQKVKEEKQNNSDCRHIPTVKTRSVSFGAVQKNILLNKKSKNTNCSL